MRMARGPRSAEHGLLPRRRPLLPLALVSGRRRPFPRSAQRGSGIHRTGRGVFPPGGIAAPADGRPIRRTESAGDPVLRAPAVRICTERVRRRREEASAGAERAIVRAGLMASPVEGAMRLTRTAALFAALVPLAAHRRRPDRSRAWAATHLPADVLALACAPSAASEMPAVPLRVTGGQSTRVRAPAPRRATSSPSTPGAPTACRSGQEFFVRRILKDRDQVVSRTTPARCRPPAGSACTRSRKRCRSPPSSTPATPCASATTSSRSRCRSWCRAPRRRASRNATTTAACCPARTGAGPTPAGDFIVIDRGRDHGITPGSQFVVYHDKKEDGNFLYQVGRSRGRRGARELGHAERDGRPQRRERGRLRGDAEVAASAAWAGGQVGGEATSTASAYLLTATCRKTRTIQRVSPARCSRR